MHINLLNQGTLERFETFVQERRERVLSFLEFNCNTGGSAVHPVALAFTACAASLVSLNGGLLRGKIPMDDSLSHLMRMGLFDFVNLPVDKRVQPLEPSGRFIPLQQVKDSKQLEDFIRNLHPLLHVHPELANPVKYMFSELVRNVLEHSDSEVGAFVCAQYDSTARRVSIGVADAGVGIRQSLRRSHYRETHEDAIIHAMSPGVSASSPNLGGGINNAGAGLFFVKCLARASLSKFILYSGDTLYRLENPENPRFLYANAQKDPHTIKTSLSNWRGTVVGVDFSLNEDYDWQELFDKIRDKFRLSLAPPPANKSLKRPRFD